MANIYIKLFTQLRSSNSSMERCCLSHLVLLRKTVSVHASLRVPTHGVPFKIKFLSYGNFNAKPSILLICHFPQNQLNMYEPNLQSIRPMSLA